MTKLVKKIMLPGLIIFFMLNLFIYYYFVLSFAIRPRISEKLISSGIEINSFNPSRIYLSLNIPQYQSSSLSIIDNHSPLVYFPQASQLSTITIMLSDGYHQLDIILIDEIERIELHQSIDIASGTQSLKVIVVDEKHIPVKNFSVHLELVDYSHISCESSTNYLGEAMFQNLPTHSKLYIETISEKTNRYAYMDIDDLNSANVTLVLQEMSKYHVDDYDPSDQGYKAV